MQFLLKNLLRQWNVADTKFFQGKHCNYIFLWKAGSSSSPITKWGGLDVHVISSNSPITDWGVELSTFATPNALVPTKVSADCKVTCEFVPPNYGECFAPHVVIMFGDARVAGRHDKL